MRFPRKWIATAMVVVCVKAVITVFVVPVTPESDFANWIHTAEWASSFLVNRMLPSVTEGGPYIGMAVFLAPFFSAWSALPIVHPPISEALSQTYFVEKYLLIFFMKLPVLLFDLLAGILVALIVSNVRSKTAPFLAFFIWYLNPYAFYLMEYMGTFDIIPAAFVLFSTLLAMRRKWAGAGFFLAIASILRLYPLFALPSFAVYNLTQGSRRAKLEFFGAFVAPIAMGLLTEAALMGSWSAVFSGLIEIPMIHPALQQFYGFPVSPILTLIPLMLVLQVYVIARCWQETSFALTNSIMASLLVLLTVSYHQPYHFTWVIPLLTVYVAVTRESPFLFGLLFASAFLSTLGFDTSNSLLVVLQPFSSGMFYGVKAWYLVRTNIRTFRPGIVLRLRETIMQASFKPTL